MILGLAFADTQWIPAADHPVARGGADIPKKVNPRKLSTHSPTIKEPNDCIRSDGKLWLLPRSIPQGVHGPIPLTARF